MIRIAYFNDGPLLPVKEGGAEKIINLIRYENIKNTSEVVLFECKRPWTNIDALKREAFRSVILPDKTFYHDTQQLVSILKDQGIDSCIFTNPETLLNIGTDLKKHGFKIIYDCHNVFSLLSRRMGEPTDESNLIEYKEYLVGQIAEVILPCSTYDLKKLQSLGIDNKKMRIVENGVNSKKIKFVGPNYEKHNILFLGNIFYEPNLNAVKRLHKLFTKATELKNYTVTIAGTVPDSVSRELSSERFKFLGYVEDLNTVFRDASVAVAPLNEGSGTRLKILNYLSAGIPTISSTIGAEGLELSDKQIIICDDIGKYPKLILDIANYKYEYLPKNGRKLIEKRYDWEVIGKKAINYIKDVLR